MLGKTLVEASVCLPIESARQLPSSVRAELELVIRDLYAQRDLQRLAAKWEPLRTLDKELKECLRDDTIDLLQDRRPLYSGLAIVSVEEAQGDARYRTYVARSMPTKDAKKLLKVWDKKLTPLPKTREQIISHLLKLLGSGDKKAA